MTRALPSVYCLSLSRTPVGSYLGALSSLSAVDLGVVCVKSILAKTQGVVNADEVDEVFFGNVVSAGTGQHPARQVALKAGLRETTPATTVNKVCASGLKAINMACQSIALGQSDVVIAGGCESMSKAPFLVPRINPKFGATSMLDSLETDGLQDAYAKERMGDFAEETVKEFALSREEQDDFTLKSYTRAKEAAANGIFKDEIAPVTIKERRGERVVDADEEPSKLDESKLRTLRPAFNPQGTITPASSSPLSDGAAAVLLVSSTFLHSTVLPRLNGNQGSSVPIYEIISYADAAKKPAHFTIAPSAAIPAALKRAGMSMGDVDLFEVNEAFAAVALANMKIMEVNSDKVNVHGGAVAMGHPLGCSGARIFVTLCNALKHHGKNIGVAGICNGGGGATATVVRTVDLNQIQNKL